MKKSKLTNALSTSLYFLGIMVLSIIVIKYIGQRTEVMGASMEPTLSGGDNLVVDKFSYLIRDPERFEIIVFPYRDGSGTYYIKRVIGLPGETIYIDGSTGNVYIDGEIIEEEYLTQITIDGGLASTPLLLGEDEYFVMGDNRINSKDSRSPEIGIVKREEISGRAIFRVWPITEMKIIK